MLHVADDDNGLKRWLPGITVSMLKLADPFFLLTGPVCVGYRNVR